MGDRFLRTGRVICRRVPVLLMGVFACLIAAAAQPALAQVVDMQILQNTAPASVVAGGNLTYRIVAVNNGPSDATDVVVTDVLPAGLTFVSMTAVTSFNNWSCSPSGGTVTCTSPFIPNGLVTTFTLVTQVSPSTSNGTVLSNTATVTSTTPEQDPSNNSRTSSTTVQAAADLSVSNLAFPNPVAAGSNLTYTMTVTNAGTLAAANATLNNPLPAGLTFISLSSPGGWSCTTPAVGASGAVNCTNASFAAGASGTFTLVAQVAPSTANGTILGSIATVSTSTTDANTSNDSATASVTAQANADLAVTNVVSPNPVTAGGNLTSTMTVTNAGPSTASSATLSNPLPAGLTFVSLASPGGWSCTTPAVGASGTVICSNASVAPGASGTFTLVTQVAPSTANGTVLSDTATVSTSSTDANSGNDSVTASATVQATADLAVTNAASPNPVTAGGNLTYTMTVSNAGPIAASSATLTNPLPAAVTFVSLATPAGWSCTTPAVGATGTVSCSNASFSVGSAVFTLVTQVASSTASGTVVSDTVTVSSATSDPASGNNANTASSTVNAAPAPDLSIALTHSGSATQGQTGFTYAIAVSNVGLGPTSGAVTVTDALPAGLTATAMSGSGWSCSVGATSSCTRSDALASGAAYPSITLTATIASNAAASLTNTAVVSGGGDTNSGNNTASDVVSVGAPTVTTAALASSSNPSAAQQPVTFTATITSGSGTPSAGTVTFRDGSATLAVVAIAAGAASFTTPSLASGSHAITAVYSGGNGFAASTSAVLTQIVNVPADSLKLRQLQVQATVVVAQNSGQAISGAVASAISEGFEEGGSFMSPSGTGVHFNFAADPDQPASARPDAAVSERWNGPLGRSGGAGLGGVDSYAGQPGSRSRIDNAFAAIDRTMATKAPPQIGKAPKDWLLWADIRGSGIDRWSGTLGTGPSQISGAQVNALLGLTRKVTPSFLVGLFGGYETFDYTMQEISGKLKGDGWTVGSYLGWKLTSSIRFDAAVAYSGIGYDGSAGTAQGSFDGRRWLVSSGLTGGYQAYGLEIEPSMRVYALWEHQNAYIDSLGTAQADRDFATGRASGGVKLAYPLAWTGGVTITPYVGLYGDYYFNRDDAAAIVAAGGVPLASTPLIDGWSARATTGVLARLPGGAALAAGGELGGIGSDYQIWTLRARGSVPF